MGIQAVDTCLASPIPERMPRVECGASSQSPKPHLEDGAIYRPRLPTKGDSNPNTD